MLHQLVKKSSTGGYENIMPKSWIEAIKDKNTGQTLVEILQGFNMYFLPYNGNTSATRCLVPTMLRKKGLWITYVKYDGNVYTEWYAANEIDDKSWGDSSNWRIGNNTLVGDITISANGNWVINGTETEFKAVGEKGNTPLLRVADNKLQVSYNLGVDYIDVTNNPVYTKFRWSYTTGDTQNNIVGRIQSSVDEGKTWTNMSNDFTNNLHISRYIGANEALPTSGIAEGTIYAKGPTYAVDDTNNNNPIYRLWVYAWKGNTLAWQDNGEFQSIAAGIVQETGYNENAVMSQKATTEKLTELATQAIYDVTANNGGATFDSLSALLSSENLSTLIPTAVRCGGMSVRFVQSSDNKYVQYRLMADNWSTDTDDWSFCMNGVLVDNPEWVQVVTDNENKVLYGTKKDGYFYYGTDKVPQIEKWIENGVKKEFPNYYIGKEINICDVKRYFRIEDFINLSETNAHCQGCATYGDYLFMVEDSNTPVLWIFNLISGERVGVVTIPITSHCNNIMFSDKFPLGSQFPYLYAGGGDTSQKMYVLSVTLNNDVFTLAAVQTIDFTNINTQLFGSGHFDFAIDFSNNVLYSLAYDSPDEVDNPDADTMICKFQLPNAEEGDITFVDSDIISHHIIPTIPVRQCLYYFDNQLYILSGYSNFKLAVLELNSYEVVTEVDFSGLITGYEAEAFVIYHNQFLIIRAGTSNIKKIIF